MAAIGLVGGKVYMDLAPAIEAANRVSDDSEPAPAINKCPIDGVFKNEFFIPMDKICLRVC